MKLSNNPLNCEFKPKEEPKPVKGNKLFLIPMLDYCSNQLFEWESPPRPFLYEDLDQTAKLEI